MVRVLVMAVGLALAVATGAGACSCVPPETVYANAESAYIGRVVDRVDESPMRVRYTIEVERAVKGGAAGRITYASNTSGASCGIDLKVGDRIGVIEARDAKELYSCSVVSVGELERLARPLPAPRKRGNPAFVVGGGFGASGFASLDSRGRIIRYGRGRLGTADACPGGSRIVASTGRRIDVRGLRTLTTLRRIRSTGSALRLRCLDAAARRIVAFHQGRDSGRLVMHDGRRTRRIVLPGAQGEVALGARSAAVAIGPYESPSVVVVDYRTGSVRTVLRSDRYVYALALSPDESRVLVAAGAIGRGGEVTVVPADGGAPLARLQLADLDSANAVWVEPDRLAIAANGSLRTFTGELRPIDTAGGWPFELAVRDGRLYSVTQEGGLVVADGEAVRRVAVLPRARVGPLVAIPPRPAASSAGTCGWGRLPALFTA